MYTQKVFSKVPLGTPAAVALATAGVHTYSEVNLSQMQVRRLMACITTATVSTGSIVVQLLARPTPGSATNQTVVGSITIPTAAVVGKVYYKELSGVAVAPGTQLVYNVSTAAAGGSAAGAAACGYESEDDPEVAVNQTSMIAG